MASNQCPRCAAGYDPRGANFCQACGYAFHGTVEQSHAVVYGEPEILRGSMLAKAIVTIAVVVAVLYLISHLEVSATVNGVMTITPLGTATP